MVLVRLDTNGKGKGAPTYMQGQGYCIALWLSFAPRSDSTEPTGGGGGGDWVAGAGAEAEAEAEAWLGVVAGSNRIGGVGVSGFRKLHFSHPACFIKDDRPLVRKGREGLGIIRGGAVLDRIGSDRTGLDWVDWIGIGMLGEGGGFLMVLSTVPVDFVSGIDE